MKSSPPTAITPTLQMTLADQCRSAALGFMAGARTWDKRALASWLLEDYQPVVLGTWESNHKLTPAYGFSSPATHRHVAARDLSVVIAEARAQVFGALQKVMALPSIKGGRVLLDAGLAARCIDEEGCTGWAPIARARMRLSDRVLSLFAADFLVRPWDYEESLVLCGCEQVYFGDIRCCERTSGIVERRPVSMRVAS